MSFLSLRTRPPSLSTFAAHFLLYELVYDEDFPQVCLVIEQVFEMFTHDEENIQSCLDTVLSCFPEFPIHFADKVHHLLQDQRVDDRVAHYFLTIVSLFVRSSPATFCAPDIVQGFGLAPQIMFACRRRLCSSVDRNRGFAFILEAFNVLE